MKNTISILSEQFMNEKTRENVEGITIIVDGVLKDFFEVIKTRNPNYPNDVTIVKDALMRGLESIKNEIDKA